MGLLLALLGADRGTSITGGRDAIANISIWINSVARVQALPLQVIWPCVFFPVQFQFHISAHL